MTRSGLIGPRRRRLCSSRAGCWGGGERLVAETHGNPLALLELPRGLTPAQLAGGFGLPNAVPLSGRIEDSFKRRFAGLPAETQRLLLVAAAEPVGDPVLVWRAGGRLGGGGQVGRDIVGSRPHSEGGES